MFSKSTALPVQYRKLTKTDFGILGIIWLIVFAIYLPAAKAGMVGDFPRWVDTVQHYSFKDYINDAGLYQFTQLSTYFFYKLFGVNAWAWHLLHVTLHSINCFLLFIIFKNLLADSAIRYANAISFAGIFIYCVSPYNAEVIVHEPCYHYLQGFLMLLLIVYWVQCYHYTRKIRYAWWAGLLYAVSIFSLEVFYLTPWFVLSIALYYRLVLAFDKEVFRRVLRWIFAPLLLLFVVYLMVQRLMADSYLTHSVVFNSSTADYLSRLPKLLFHTLFLGRFFSNNVRQQVYSLCTDPIFPVSFYALLVIILLSIIIRFRRLNIRWKIAGLLLIWMLLGVSIVVPMPFPDIQLSVFDRYTYFMTPFLYLLLALIFSMAVWYVAITLWALYSLVNIYCCLKINRYWHKSATLVNKLIQNFPDVGNKTVLLLNNPENIEGIGLIGSRPESNFKVLYNVMHEGKKINTAVYDVASYNVLSTEDGAHVNVENDSTIKVTLNQWGTWWWFRYMGAGSRETFAFKMNMRDVGHWYELTLKQAAQEYILLYETNGQWKQVDWNKKSTDQY